VKEDGNAKENDPRRPSTRAATRQVDVTANISLRKDIEEECAALDKQASLVMIAPTKSALSSSCTGSQVKRQVEVFRKLQAIRIELQKPFTMAHRLPQKEVKSGEMDAMHAQAWHLFEELSKLQGRPRGPAAPSLQLPKLSRKRQRDETWETLEKRNEAVFNWSLGIFDEVKERTKLEARKGFKVLDQSFAAQLNTTMRDDEWRRKCHPSVGSTEVMGGPLASEDAPYDPLIYSDRDFYTMMLKDIVQQHGDASAKEAATLSKRQARKLKERNVERRASKGRKIRYKVHDKLQNFMAPSRMQRLDPLTTDQYMKSLFQ